MEPGEAYKTAEGLRLLADFLDEEHASLPNEVNVVVWSHIYSGDVKGRVAEAARAGMRHGLDVKKDYSNSIFKVEYNFTGIDEKPTGIKYSVEAMRKEVCEAVVVGTEEYEEDERVGEDTRPFETVTKTRDVIEWKCDPILKN